MCRCCTRCWTAPASGRPPTSDRVHSGPTTGTDQAATERESFARTYAGRSDQLMTVERGLCFGRIDTVDGATFYIGRIGLFDDDHDPLLIDWRAPVAQPFYRATAADPAGSSGGATSGWPDGRSSASTTTSSTWPRWTATSGRT